MIAHIEKGMIEGEESSDMQNIFGDIDFSLWMRWFIFFSKFFLFFYYPSSPTINGLDN